MKAKKILIPFLGFALGTVAGASLLWLLADVGALVRQDEPRGIEDAEEPLYWVAPMDPNYRRDQPGRSPMGMDLVPIYDSANEDQDGVVTISPAVINNLGVQTERVVRGRLSPTVETVGYVQFDENQIIHIHPRVEGWIEQLYVKAEGDPVREGEPLYAIYSPTLVNAQEEFLLALRRGNTALVDAAEQRLLALQVPPPDVAEVKRTRELKQTIIIKAPKSGVLDHLNIREGMFVEPGMEVMSIGQVEHIWVIGDVFERQAASVRPGDSVRMRLDYLPDREWTGSVDYIYPSLDKDSRTARVRIYVDNSDRLLRPGMFAQIAIAMTPGKPGLLVAKDALIRTADRPRVVLALTDGRFKSVPVHVSGFDDQHAEIMHGLQEGDRIVTSAHFLIDSESNKSAAFARMSREPGPAQEEHEGSHAAALTVKSMSEHQHPNSDHGEPMSTPEPDPEKEAPSHDAHHRTMHHESPDSHDMHQHHDGGGQ